MAPDKPSFPSAGTLAATIATGMVGVFAALAPQAANAHGGGGGHGGGFSRGGGMAMGHAAMGGGRMMGGARFNGGRFNGGNFFRGNRGFREFRGFRGPRIFIGGNPFFYGVPYYYGPSYYMAPPVYVAPPTYNTESAPQQSQQPASSGQRFCYPWKDQLTCSYPDGSIHKFSVSTVAPAETPAPLVSTTPPLPSPPPPKLRKAPAPHICHVDVYQVTAFGPSSSIERQYPENGSIPDNCRTTVRQINLYNDKPATGLDFSVDKIKGRAHVTANVTYNGVSTAKSSTSLLHVACPSVVFNVGAITPSSAAWDDLFAKVPEKCGTSTFKFRADGNTPADAIRVTLNQRRHGGWEDSFKVDPAPQAAQTVASAAPGKVTVQTSTPGSTVTTNVTATPHHVSASSTTAPSKGHWYTSWWLWGPVLAIAGAAALVASINKSRYPTDPAPHNPEGGPEGGGAPRPETGASEPIIARRESAAPKDDPLHMTTALKAFNDAEKRGILTAFLENRGDPANQIRFKLNETRDAMLVSTKDADAEIRRDGSKATLKTGAVTFSDETIKGMLESHYNLNGGAGKEGKHRIAVTCSDEVFARVVALASTAEGQPFEIVRKPAKTVDNRISPGETAAETPARPVAANDAQYRSAQTAPVAAPKVAA